MTTKKICACEQQLYHSSVIDSRFRWNKTYRRYTKYRRRQCDECGGRFATIEINRKEFKGLINKTKEFQNLIDKAKKFENLVIKAKEFKKITAKTKKTDQIKKAENIIKKAEKLILPDKEITGKKDLSNSKNNFSSLIDSL